MNRTFEKYLEIANLIEHFHKREFKVIDIIHNDLYRHMNDAGLFDYDYIIRGGGKSNPSKTNLVFLIWLMIAKELKEFGTVKTKLNVIKDFLFEEFDIINSFSNPPSTKDLLQRLETFEFEDIANKREMRELILSGKLMQGLKGKKVSRLFWIIFEILTTGKDIQLHITKDGTPYFYDESELSEKDINILSYEKKIVLPIKSYLNYFVGEYAPTEFLTRSKILTKNEAKFLNEFRRNDIVSLTVKYHNKKPNIYETKVNAKIDMQNKLADVLSSSSYEDVTIKTKKGQIYYVELTRKEKFN